MQRHSLLANFKFAIFALGFIGLIFSSTQAHSAVRCAVKLDDFSGESLDLDNWNDPESSRYISAGKLNLSQKLISNKDKSTFSFGQRYRLDFIGPFNDFEAQIAITEADLTASGTGSVFASVRGTFYNTTYTDAQVEARRDPITGDLNETGDIYAAINVGDMGNGLEAWWHILQSTDKYFQTSDELAAGTLIGPGILNLNTEYPIKIDYDGTTGFTFTLNGVSVSENGPVKKTTADYGFRRLSAGAVPDDNSDNDPISIAATFDNIKTNGFPFDDFSSPQLDMTKWQHDTARRYINNGRLKLEAVNQLENSRESAYIRPDFPQYKDADCMQATLNLQSNSVVPMGARGRLRLEGYWYNTSFNDTSGYNGFEGNVWGQVVIEKIEDGRIRATAYAEEADDAAYNNYTQLFFHEFNLSVSMNTDYIVGIKLDKDNKQLIFSINDEEFIYNIGTNVNPPWPEEDYNMIRARIQNKPGEIYALVDDVYITPAGYIPPSIVPIIQQLLLSE